MANLPEIPICPSCSFRNLPVAGFCGGCGQRLTSPASLPSAGVVSSGGQFRTCRDAAFHDPSSADATAPDPGNSTDGPESSVSSPLYPETATQAVLHNGGAIPGTVGAATVAVQAALANRVVPLLLSGVVCLGLAQLGLYFSVEPNTKAPLGYLLLLSIGLLLSAMGSMGLRLRRSPGERDSDAFAFKTSRPAITPNPRSPLGVLVLLIGIVALASLLIMLAAGSESGGAILVWLTALTALAAPFVPQVTAATL